MSFSNKVVLITGAGSGIGKAMALKFAKLSATLSLIDRDDSVQTTCESCEKLSSAKVLKHVMDIRNDDLVQKAVDDTVKEFGKIDVLINCAGIYRPFHGKIVDTNVMENFDETMSVNLRALIRMTNCAASYLIESKGCIVNIASIFAAMVTDFTFSYNVSKSAVCHFTKCVALELAPHGVRVNAIMPGPVRTKIMLNAGCSKEGDEKNWSGAKAKVPLQKLIDADEIADFAAYLASDRARSITGGNYPLDGGFALRGSC